MTKSAAMHLLTEFGPVLAFFIAGQTVSFYNAVVVLVVSTTLAMLTSLWHERRIPFLPLISGIFVIISGGITYFYTAPDAVIVADSLYYLLLALAVGIGLSRRTYFLKWLFQSTFAMYDEGWRILSWRWLILFLIATMANETVRLIFTPEVWVDFRFFKILLFIGFAGYQFTLSRKYRIPEESNSWGLRV